MLAEVVAQLEQDRLDNSTVLLPGLKKGGAAGCGVDAAVAGGQAVEQAAPLLLTADVHDVSQGTKEGHEAVGQQLRFQ